MFFLLAVSALFHQSFFAQLVLITCVVLSVILTIVPASSTYIALSNTFVSKFVQSPGIEPMLLPLSYMKAVENASTHKNIYSLLRLSHSCEPCADGWTAYDGNCYFFSSEKQTWFDSNLSCGALDAHLVIIETEKEQGFLKSKIQVFHWIGLNDLDTEGRWVWVNNQTLDETGVQFWLKRESGQSEPDNWKGRDSSGEHCAIMRIWDQWCDVPCKSNYNFICEKKQISSLMHDD
ncbi:putative C-type lectin domain family 4 member F-like [Triplophysa rosa]|uniref:C-type lectin domain family 4 member F-like n=1 Tax=Triplophysa rosa TaxID=992332 RepID=A0A9W7T4D3_TRIRA|nr:putative C-type lectin domain family 4 member F-like [Triplophysa rosa]